MHVKYWFQQRLKIHSVAVQRENLTIYISVVWQKLQLLMYHVSLQTLT